jgi:hypothetical protein
MMFGTHDPDSPSSAVSLLNWRRWALATVGTPTVDAMAAALRRRRKARLRAVELPGTHMTRGADDEARGTRLDVVVGRSPGEAALV